ncbi:FxSxx-COOH system tetratricopeptide repeat protein [Mangrovihabitans endophyticus]|uniref:NB-ARC domain-containing protein n=1 Tax=Mangrovihabitans endophyticus TaxID=1751298 RepID=A0A8J3FKC5_9ACTN|nr:FxSxx-COOH system tetratricopeptide repeat protein [Mangrovihabitans endophyticus]GGK72190.1 hypothetical protein GCM10012284_02510 [Mangrovihabitans endophyticus]
MASAPRPGPLPDGPLRDLVLALRGLHRAAGKPGARQISAAIRDSDDMRDTVSHETVSAMLRGGGLPKWVKVECVVRQLVAWAVTGPDTDEEIRRFHRLWLAADDAPSPVPAGAPSPARRDFVARSPAPPEREPPRGGPAISNLPARPRHFTGRTGMLEEIRATVTGPQGPPLSLVGLGGVGKTQLALEYAHRWTAEYDVAWWVPAEQPSQAIAALAALGEQLEIRPAADMRQTMRDVLSFLEDSALRWLLIYDNADQPDDLAAVLPAIGGHALVTSRNTAWAQAAPASVRVGVFSRPESLSFLREAGLTGSAEDCEALADHLGDLPLGLDQVCAMHSATGMPVAEYLRLFAEHFDELLAAGLRAGSRTTTVTTFVNVAAGRLRTESVAAAQLLEMLAFMAPMPVPVALLHRGRDAPVAAPLGRALHRTDELARIVARLGRYGLAQVDGGGQEVQVHRLVQLVVRNGLPPDAASARRSDVHRLLAAANPGDPDDSRTWPLHGEIGPHLLAADALHADRDEPRTALLHQIRYLERIGDFQASERLARAAEEAWRVDRGPEHRLTVLATRHLANALRALGRYAESRHLVITALGRLRASAQYGEEHPDTLTMAAVAGFHLRLGGAYAEAVDEDQRRVDLLTRLYGPRDPRTTDAAGNLGVSLRLDGRAGDALRLDDETVRILRADLGSADPRTLVAARNLAWSLLDVGRFGEAVRTQRANLPGRVRFDETAIVSRTLAVGLRRLGHHREALEEATAGYRTCQERFGPDHHLTLAAIMTYANTLRAAGDPIGARRLAGEALDRYRRLFGRRNPLTLAAATNLAVALRAVGQWREAAGNDEQTYEDAVRVLGPAHPHTLVAAVGLATDLAHQHNAKEAVVLGRATLAGLRHTRGEDHPETWACALNLALDLGPDGDADRRAATERLTAMLGPDHPEVLAATAGTRMECDAEPPPT